MTQDDPEHQIRATGTPFMTNVSRKMSSESHQACVPDYTSNPTGTWPCSMEKITHMPNYTNISKTVEETEDHELEELFVDSTKPFEVELLEVVNTEVQ